MANQLESDVLSGPKLDEALGDLPGWTRDGLKIRKQFAFPSFADAIRFVDKVAASAEAANHHPDIDIRFKKIDVIFWTHKMNAVTRADIAGAREVERIGG